MKQKLKRIICIVLVLICLCMQGCLLVSISNCAEDRYISIAKKYMQEHKQIADAFIPEMQGYTLELKRTVDFASLNDAITQGYITRTDEFLYENLHGNENYFAKISVKSISNDDKVNGYQFVYDSKNEKQKTFNVMMEDTNRHISFFSILEGEFVYFNEKIFLITYTDECSMIGGDRYKKNTRPPAVYIVNFDQEKLIYVGYFNDYFSMVQSNNYFVISNSELSYKIIEK